EVDYTVLGYAAPRLPQCITDITDVFLGQSMAIFQESGLDVENWSDTYASARRRRYLYDGGSRLVAFLSSKSDIDDVIPTLLAFQIEWNKIHEILKENGDLDESGRKLFSGIFKDRADEVLEKMRKRPCSFSLVNCESSYSRYKQETENWWRNLSSVFPSLSSRTVYFVSSNTHSLINLLSGFAESIETELLEYGRRSGREDLVERYVKEEGNKFILYYLLKSYESEEKSVYERRMEWEKSIGIVRHYNRDSLDISTQIIDLSLLKNSRKTEKAGFRIPQSMPDDSVIVNIDYPLGRTAYFVLSKLSEHLRKIAGIYVIGKAASLVADRGDIIIPETIYDQQTRTRYHVDNVFDAQALESCLSNPSAHGIYDRQKAVTVLGTFIQNRRMLDSFRAGKIMDIEMEAGPYLSAYYEMTNPNRYPEDSSVVFAHEAVEFGIIHYVSDNPNGRKKLDQSLAFDGIDATYAATTAVLKRITKGVEK
ncbi:MAG: DUF6909 family protein, partial [Candidatus Ornithospirochaeta sp.]